MADTSVVSKSVLVNEDDEILLIRRSETDKNRPLQWDLPGGWVDDSEDFVKAASREIEEETGLKVPHDKLDLTWTKTKVTKHGNTCWLMFVGHIKKAPIKLSWEHDKYTWIKLDKAIDEVQYDLHKELLTHIRDNNLLS